MNLDYRSKLLGASMGRLMASKLSRGVGGQNFKSVLSQDQGAQVRARGRRLGRGGINYTLPCNHLNKNEL